MKTNNGEKKSRRVDGILLIDKPRGLTSNAALQRVKRLLHAKKAGHTGSLDPIADGLLPICLGEATKFSHYLLNADKSYVVKAQLGARTATGDSEGEITAEKSVPKLTRRELEKFLESFRGAIQQVPSMYSALKHHGQPLYKLARQGIEVHRESRSITIHELKMTDWQENILELYVHCSKGTYIRTLVDDLGEAIGCGAYVVALRRLSVAHYEESQITSLTRLEKEYDEENLAALDHYLLPVESMIMHLSELKLSKTTAFYLCRGHAVMVPNAPTEGFVRLLDHNNSFLGIGEVLSDGKIAPKRLVKSM